ncbi:OmpA/MotB family protein [Lacrimispora sp.]|uniref:OmpA/MotB family protein n=1 Tax=Lacrimispora sp. TaxID=2719234 RepID=UPI0028552372|nr:OmpA family protein [Lacrimispora sp.]MDR7813867.1 OmpA family protein [Lacrimispora sp.]
MGRFHRIEEEYEEEEASWQDSYSDLMTDLLAIFVILFAFAMMNQALTIQENKREKEAAAIQQQNNFVSNAEEFNKLYEYIKTYIEEEQLTNELSVTKLGNDQILLRVAASVFFDSGRAEIDDAAEPVLQKISEILVTYQDSFKMVRIEGHTDNRPINTYLYASNWELSTSRAVNVLRWLLDTSGIEAKKFSAIGYSEYYPVEDNSTNEGKRKNRRVDFFIEGTND